MAENKRLALHIPAGILAASALAGCDSGPQAAKAADCAPRATAAPRVLRRARPDMPAGLEPVPRGAREMRGSEVGPAWREIADRQALRGYTNTWTDGLANFTLAAVRLTPGDELSHATLILGRAAGRSSKDRSSARRSSTWHE